MSTKQVLEETKRSLARAVSLFTEHVEEDTLYHSIERSKLDYAVFLA